MSGLLHDVFTGKAIAALPEHLYQRLRESVAVDIEAVAKIPIGMVFLHISSYFFMKASQSLYAGHQPTAGRWDP